MFRIFILLIASLFSSARGINYGRFETVPLASDASVANCFAQDSLGLIWIGTNRGLYSYDGYSVRSHSSASDSSCSQIYCILRRGNTFYLGSDNGLFAYDCTGDYYSPRMEISSKAGTAGPGISTMPKNVRALAMCGNRLWIGSLNGLYRYDFDTGRLDTLTRGLPHKTIYSLLVTSGGDIYVGTYNGLCRYLPSTDSFERIRIPSGAGKNNTFVNSLLEDRERGCIWIGTEGNLYKYMLSDDSVSAVGMVADNSVKSLALDTYGNLIIGTDNGLYIYNGRDGKHFVHDSRNHETVSNDIVWSVFVDNEHNLWLGTEYNISLARNDRDKRTVPIAELTGKGEGNRFYSILKDSHGYLWLGGTNGLVRYDARRGKSVSYKMSDKKNPVPHNRIRDIYEDSEKGLWVATDGSIIKYDYARSRFDKYLITDSSRTMNANWSYSIFEDKSGKLWIGAYLGGVFVVDRKALLSSGGTPCMAERNFSSSNGLPGNLINQMVQGKNGNAWVLIYKGGLYRIDESSGKVDREDIEKATGESPDYIISDDNGNIWCGFAGGIAMRSDDGTKWSVARFGEFDKSGVLSMEQVGNTIWAGTSDGVWAVGEDMNPVRLNLRSDPYTCIYYDKNSEIVYLGGVDKIVETTPDIINSGHGTSTIRITGFSVNDKPYSLPEKSVRYAGKYKLKYNQNHLYFEFSTISYSQEEKSRFICMMEGVDKDWSLLPQNSNHVSYANLKYGNYSFKVNTLDVNGRPGPSPETVSIRISPPWYYTSAAKICYAAFLLGLVLWIINFFRVKNRLRIERIEKDKTLEQAKLKMDFFANLSHEFKTPLSMILSPADKLLSEVKDKHQTGQVEMIRQNAVKLDTLIHKALDFNRLDDNPDDFFIPSKVEMVEFCKSIFSVYKDNFEDKTFIFESTPDKIYTSIDPVKMESVLNNVISNACKYTPSGGSVNFRMGYSADGSKIDISVSDDGIGIPSNEIPYIFQRFFQSSRTADKKGGTGIGLYLAKCYVEMHNGTISASSGENGGTVISITLPSGRQESLEVPGNDGQSSPEEKAGRKKIAVIDDNIAITEFIKDTLSGEYDCEIAHNGKAGLTLCREIIPDLIIADLMMPVMDGLEMCRRIKKDGSLSLIPIILLTAKTDIGTELKSINLNIDIFMPKPFDAAILLSRVRQLLESKEQVESQLRIEKIATPEKVEMMSFDEKFLSDITRIIEDNMSDQTLNVAFLSDKANVSQKQLYRKVRLLTGFPPVEYIRQIRMKKAAMLLKQKRFTISEVMYMVGFSSSSYFSKCFQSQFGISPKQFTEDAGMQS